MESAVKISTRVDEAFRKRIKVFATKNGLSLEHVIVQALREYLQREQG